MNLLRFLTLFHTSNKEPFRQRVRAFLQAADDQRDQGPQRALRDTFRDGLAVSASTTSTRPREA